MSDVFGRTDQVLAGGLSADALFLSWPDLTAVGGGLGLLIQQIGLSYRQSIRRIFEIGPGIIPGAGTVPGGAGITGISGSICDSPAAGTPGVAALCALRTQPTYYIISRPEGQIQFGRFIGPNLLTTCFYRKYGSPCSPNVMTLSGKAGCSSTDSAAKRITYVIGGVTLTDISMNVSGQEMVMQENVSAMFTSLRIEVEGDDGNCNSVNGQYATLST